VSERVVTGESAEMYLKAIFELTAIDPLVAISALADRLGISVVSATEMVHRMQDQGLLEHKRYKGVQLTNEGKREALDIIRRHRLWERFLVDQLKLPWEDSHDLACQLEHAAGSEVVEAMDTFLGQPTHCPHGNPIPTAEGAMTLMPGLPMESLRVGETCIVQRIRPETNAALSYLASHGVKPGVHISVKSINAFDQLWTLEIGEKEQVLSKAMISRVVVQLVDDPPGHQENGKELE
jgi:DtxR family Mn-dependent transcriptional regulator